MIGMPTKVHKPPQNRVIIIPVSPDTPPRTPPDPHFPFPFPLSRSSRRRLLDRERE